MINYTEDTLVQQISRRQVKTSLDRLRKEAAVRAEGEKRGRRYWSR